MNSRTQKIIKVIVTLVVFIGIILGLYYLLKHLGVTDKESLQEIIKSAGAWAPIIFLILQVVVTTALSVIPGTSLTFLAISGIIFDNVVLAISLSLIGVWISSILMFIIGKTLGEKVAIKLVGKESLVKAQELIDTKAKIYLPIMFVFPFFPDDALCLAAGLTKMRYRYFIPMTMITRSIGVLATVLSAFYFENLFILLGLDKLHPIEWVLLINVLLFDAYVIYKITKIIEVKIDEKKKTETKDVEEEMD